MRFRWSISLPIKNFHLALEMLLSNALWQTLVILRTYLPLLLSSFNKRDGNCSVHRR